LLFSIYSVWFQYYKVKSWCYFCLIILLIFWSECIFINYGETINYGSFLLSLNVRSILVFAFSFTMAITIVTYVVLNLKKEHQLFEKNNELNRIKFNKTIMDFSWGNSRKIIPLKDDVLKLLNNANAIQTLTIVTNPTCAPCANTHKKLESYLKGAYSNLNINIIFSTPMNDINSTRYKVTKKILQIFKQKGSVIAIQALETWFNDNKKDFDKWDKEFIVENCEVSDMMTTHLNWCIANKIKYTPTIILNGVEIPDIYTVSDVKHFLD
jgi:Thioredoxin